MSSKFSEIKTSIEIKPAIKQEGKEIKTELEKGPVTKQEKDLGEKSPKDNKDHKDSKEHKEQKEHKEHKDIKDQIKEHKHEFPEKTHKDKDLEKAAPETGALQPSATVSQTSVFKPVFKNEKAEIFEKFQHSKFEKFEKFEKNEISEIPIPVVPIDPGGPVEQRLAALESAMAQLMHFIPESLRPDLSSGALKQEADAAKPAQTDKGAASSTPAQPEKPEAPSDKGKK